mgnify:CR=1 FL=1
MHRKTLGLALLLCLPAAASAAPDSPPMPRLLAPEARIAVENQILEERLETLLPRLMAEARLDMWLVLSREYAEDPVYFTLVPQPSFAARRTTLLVFHRKPDGTVERLDAEQLRQLGAGAEAEEALRTALKRKYESHLARLYGLVRGSDPSRQLQTAEHWLKEHADDPSLLLTLGRLCLQNSLWGKARDYLESSLRVQRNPEACAELARLLAQLGDTERSNQLFQEGLGLLDERLLAAPLPAPVHA